MSRPRVLPAGLALAGGAAAAVALAAGALAGWWRPASAERPLTPLRASATVEPQSALFGDPLRARVDVVVDPEVVRPASVTVAAAFAPYLASEPVVTRSGGRISFSYRLTCLTDSCLPRRQGFAFRPAAVRATTRDSRRLSAQETWPTVMVGSRLTAAEVAATRPGWHESTQLAPVTWRIDPRLLAGPLVGGSALFALTAGVLVGLALRRRSVQVPAPPAPEHPPLELALARVRRSARAGTPAERRRALEQLARVLRTNGDSELARAAICLAWSGDRPSPARVEAFADEVARAETSR